MADLRGQKISASANSSSKSKIVGAVLVALLFGAGGIFYYTSGTAHAAKPAPAKTYNGY